MIYTKKGVTGCRHSLFTFCILSIAYAADQIKIVGIFHFLYVEEWFHHSGYFPYGRQTE